MNSRRRVGLLGALVLLGSVWLPTLACGYEIEPLTTRNLTPAVIGFGLPALGPARVLKAHETRLQGTLDIANNFNEEGGGGETLRFDGETYRLALAADYGIGNGFEIGAELPLISHREGFLDGFIENWHSVFGLPQSGRDVTPHNRLDYRYARSDGGGFALDSETTALGDLALRAAWQCWRDAAAGRALALRASLKLPTGDAQKLTGSGGADLALWLSGEQRSGSGAGALVLYGGGGMLFSSDGELLADQRRNLVGLVNLGLGWQPTRGVGLQLQFDGHSAFYDRSQLKELNAFAGELAIGGSLALGERTALELAVVEDIIVKTAPDVVFHLALRHTF